MNVPPSSALAAALAVQQIHPAPPRGPLGPNDLIRCRLGCEMLAKRCVLTRAATYPSGKRKGRSVSLACRGCPVGAAVARRLRGFEVPRYFTTPAEVMDPAERRAKLRWERERLPDRDAGDLWRDDPLRAASALTPDDSAPTVA